MPPRNGPHLRRRAEAVSDQAAERIGFDYAGDGGRRTLFAGAGWLPTVLRTRDPHGSKPTPV